MTREEALTEWVIPAIRKTWNEKKCAEILKALDQEPCIQEKQANADKIDAVYIDGFKAGYSQARFDLEQEHCDAVSRKEVMNMLHNHAFDYATSTKISALIKTMRGEVDRMPSVQPKRRTGRWIDRQKGTGILYPLWQRWECSECGAYSLYGSFCQDCGAKMQEVDE